MQTQMSNIKPLSVKPYIKRNKQYDYNNNRKLCLCNLNARCRIMHFHYGCTHNHHCRQSKKVVD